MKPALVKRQSTMLKRPVILLSIEHLVDPGGETVLKATSLLRLYAHSAYARYTLSAEPLVDLIFVHNLRGVSIKTRREGKILKYIGHKNGCLWIQSSNMRTFIGLDTRGISMTLRTESSMSTTWKSPAWRNENLSPYAKSQKRIFPYML